MRKRDPTPVMVIDEGKCQLIGEAKGNEFDGVQEPLPDAMRVLLCLIDGAERRHRLGRKWQSQAAHDLHVEVEGGDIMVTLPGTSYAVTYYKLANSPTASWQTLAGPGRSTVSDLAGGVRRKSLEARQRQGARAGVESWAFG
jgi:hypothetical protein